MTLRNKLGEKSYYFFECNIFNQTVKDFFPSVFLKRHSTLSIKDFIGKIQKFANNATLSKKSCTQYCYMPVFLPVNIYTAIYYFQHQIKSKCVHV